MPIKTKIVRIYKELLSIVYRRKEKNQILASKQLTVKKRSGLLDIKKLIKEPQTLKGTISKYLDLRVKWRNKQFIIIVNSGVIKNYITPKVVKKLKIPY